MLDIQGPHKRQAPNTMRPTSSSHTERSGCGTSQRISSDYPQWDRNRLIPPIRPDTPEEGGTQPFSRSPYEATLEEFVERFIINHDRAVLIQDSWTIGPALHHEGITRGFQWVNGSFVENVEEWQENAHTPNDIDVITYYYPPGTQNPNVAPLFWPPETKQRFHIDARGVQLGLALDEGTGRHRVLLRIVVTPHP